MSALPSTGRADHAVLGADATRTLYERYGSRIFAFCFSRLGNREEAEDATQTTFLNAFRSLHGGVVPAFELAWLFRIAENVCRDRRKSAWRRTRFEAARDLDELQDVIAASENGSDGLAGLDDALASMPERQRRAILLREWQGLSYGEIAQELGVSRAVVETLIFRARRSLARELEAPQSRRRVGLDLGSLLTFAKVLFSGSSAVKAAAVVAGAGLIVAAPLSDSERQSSRPPAIRPAAAVTPPAGVRPDRPYFTAGGEARRASRPGAGKPAVRASADGPVRSAPRTRRTPGRTVAKAPLATRAPDARPEPEPAGPTGAPSPPAPGQTPVATPPAPPPPAPTLPEVPSVPKVPTVEPPPLPPLPDLPVDVPDVPPLRPLPPLP